LLFQGSLVNIIVVTLTALAGVWSLSGCVGGYLIRPIGGIERTALGISGLLLFYAGALEDVIGMIIMGAIVLLQLSRNRAGKQPETGKPRR
jgi:TRAP-type uncharacterized transport system fused permease subunit